jgi:hypothetical protein
MRFCEVCVWRALPSSFGVAPLVAFLPDEIYCIGTGGAAGSADFPVRRDLIFQRNILAMLTGQLLRDREVGFVTDIMAEADPPAGRIHFANVQTERVESERLCNRTGEFAGHETARDIERALLH